MDLAWIVGLIAAVLGGGGIGALLLNRHNKRKLSAETGKLYAEAGLLDAQAEDVEAGTLVSIICILRGELDRLSARLASLEKRVTALELENRGLRQMVDQFRDLVRRLWTIVIDNGLDADMDLAVAVAEALEDSTA